MSSAAERVARMRRRRRAGLLPIVVEVDDVVVPEFLIAAGYLEASDQDDRTAIAAAVSTFLAEATAGAAWEDLLRRNTTSKRDRAR